MAEARWYPTPQQLGEHKEGKLVPTNEKIEVALREILRLHYSLTDKVNDLHGKVSAMPQVAGTRASQVPNSAAITNILGLPISPSDTTQLADGTKLTYVAATRSFKFL